MVNLGSWRWKEKCERLADDSWGRAGWLVHPASREYRERDKEHQSSLSLADNRGRTTKSILRQKHRLPNGSIRVHNPTT